MKSTRVPTRRLAMEVILAWLLWLGIDLFAHGGLFVNLYENDSPFLLSDSQLFARIPLGYGAFLIYCGMTAWLVRRMEWTGWRRGLFAGLSFGGLVTIAGNMALLSISSVGFELWAAWTGTQLVEFAAVGIALGWIADAPSRRKVAVWVLGVAVACVVAGIVAQNLLQAAD